MKIDEIECIDPLELFAILRGISSGPAFVIGGSGGGRRYSYMSVDPFLLIEGSDDPFIELKEVMGKFKFERGPFPFSGGAVGYFSYDLREKIFDSPASSDPNLPPLIPDSILALFDPIVVCDHKEGKTYIVERGIEGSAERARNIKALLKDKKMTAPAETVTAPLPSAPKSNLTREENI